jgi:hypothetical protein
MKFSEHPFSIRYETPSDLFSRPGNQLDLPAADLTLSSPLGRRTVFGCSSELRHILNPDGSAVRFDSKADQVQRWIVPVKCPPEAAWLSGRFSSKANPVPMLNIF